MMKHCRIDERAVENMKLHLCTFMERNEIDVPHETFKKAVNHVLQEQADLDSKFAEYDRHSEIMLTCARIEAESMLYKTGKENKK